jgi:hypothetical protein
LGLGDFRLRRYEGVTNDSSCWRAILLFLFHLLGETPQTKINIVKAAPFYRMPALGISASIISMAIV